MRKGIKERAFYCWECGSEVLALWPDGTLTFEIEPHKVDAEFAEKWAAKYNFRDSPTRVSEMLQNKAEMSGNISISIW